MSLGSSMCIEVYIGPESVTPYRCIVFVLIASLWRTADRDLSQQMRMPDLFSLTCSLACRNCCWRHRHHFIGCHIVSNIAVCWSIPVGHLLFTNSLETSCQ